MSADSITLNVDKAVNRNDEELRIVMVGKTGAGKSATGNTILGFKAFESKPTFRSVTVNCKKERGMVAGRKVTVIDTPGLFDTKFSEEETIREITQCICFASPGPHVFLIVIKVDRFTGEEQRAVQIIQEIFGQMSNAYSMILFTKGDQLGNETVEEMLKDEPVLQGIVDTCDGRYHVFNNTTKDPSQVTELLEKINSILEMNGGSHYTTEMFQAAERALEEEKQRILRENEEQRDKEMAELQKKCEKRMAELEERYEKRMAELEENATSRLKEELTREMAELRKDVEVSIKEMQDQHQKEARSKAEIMWTGIRLIGGLIGPPVGAAVWQMVRTGIDVGLDIGLKKVKDKVNGGSCSIQ